MKLRLGVNIDHVATLRQVRGATTNYPDILKMAKMAVAGGADQITIHLREDRRHIQEFDVAVLVRQCSVPINLEMALNDDIVKIAKKNKPYACCLVPEKREELTTEGGLDVVKFFDRVKEVTIELQERGIHVSHFIDPDTKQVEASHNIGADAIELHTGHWVLAKGDDRKDHWERLVAAAQQAGEAGLRVHAGHGLDFATAEEIVLLPHLEEVNIGHSIVCYALEMGIDKAVRKMKEVLLYSRRSR